MTMQEFIVQKTHVVDHVLKEISASSSNRVDSLEPHNARPIGKKRVAVYIPSVLHSHLRCQQGRVRSV